GRTRREPARHPGTWPRRAGPRRPARARLRPPRRHQDPDSRHPHPSHHPQPGGPPARAHGRAIARRDRGDDPRPRRRVRATALARSGTMFFNAVWLYGSLILLIYGMATRQPSLTVLATLLLLT